MNIIAQTAYNSLDSFPMLAVFFFVLAGIFMGKGGLSGQLIGLADMMIGPTYRRSGHGHGYRLYLLRGHFRFRHRHLRRHRHDHHSRHGGARLFQGLLRGHRRLLQRHRRHDSAQQSLCSLWRYYQRVHRQTFCKRHYARHHHLRAALRDGVVDFQKERLEGGRQGPYLGRNRPCRLGSQMGPHGACHHSGRDLRRAS